MKKIINFLIENGIKPEFDEELKIHIRIANFISILFVFFTIPFVLINLKDPTAALVRASSILPGLLAWLFIRFGWNLSGRVLAVLTFPLTIYVLGGLLLIDDGTFGFAPKVWILGSAVLPFLVLKFEEWKAIVFTLLIDLLLLATFDKFNALVNLPGLTKNLDRPQMRMIATFGSFILISSVVFYVKKQIFDRNRLLNEKNQQLNNTVNELIAAEEELKQANSELQALNDDLNTKKQLLEDALKNIKSSHNYARTIQKAVIFPRLDILKKYVREYLLIYKPKEEVGGDFVYIEELDNRLAIAVGDATGHGVPGALMSMLALSILDNALHNKNAFSPAEKLDFARYLIIKTLNQEQSTTRDGFDVALIIYDPQTKTIHYSGANISLYQYKDKKLIRYKADKLPIGYYPLDKNFTNYTIPVEKGQTFYAFSDGFSDQFGGAFDRKFGVKNFVGVLEKIADLPMDEQKNFLEQILSDWMKTTKNQIDDITVFGFRI